MKRQYETKVMIQPIQLNFSGSSDDTDNETVSDIYFDDSYASAISLEQVLLNKLFNSVFMPFFLIRSMTKH